MLSTVIKTVSFQCNDQRHVQYVVLGPRLKVINLNILPESSRNELKYSLKIAFMFLSMILKFQVPDINILLGIRKKPTVFDGPWSANHMSGKQHEKNVKMLYIPHKNVIFTILHVFFSFRDAIKLKFFSEDVVSIKYR